MNIKEVEKQIGISSKNIRFYEEEGLIKIARNPENGYREFNKEAIVILQEIKMFRCLGIALEDIRKYQRKEMTLKEMMDHRLRELDETQENMQTMKSLCEAIRSSDTPMIPYVVESCNALYAKPNVTKLPSMGKRQMNIRIFWACYPFALVIWFLLNACLFPMIFNGLFEIDLISEQMANTLPYHIITVVISIFLGVFSAILLNIIYAINRHQFFEMREQGMFFIDEEQMKSKVRLCWSILRGKTEKVFQFIPYSDIYKVEPGLRVAGFTAYTSTKLFSIVFRIGTVHDENIVVNTGLFGQDQKGIELLMHTLKHHAKVVNDPYKLMETQDLKGDAYQMFLNKVFDHHMKMNREHHHSDSLWY